MLFSKKHLPRQIDRETGISLVEFSLAAPVLLTCILLFVDIARFYTAKSYMDYGVQRAIAEASVSPGLGNENPSPDEQEKTIHEVAVEQVSNMAKNYLRNSLGGDGWVKNLTVTFDIPEAGSLVNSLNSNPMHIRMTGEFNSVFPYLSIPFAAEAFGYREQKFVSTMPALVNCYGQPAGTSGQDLQSLNCPCDDDPLKRPAFDHEGYQAALDEYYWAGETGEEPDPDDYVSGECVCAPGMTSEGSDSCRCISESAVLKTHENGITYCKCAACSSDLHRQVANTCECICHYSASDDGEGGCKCADDQEKVVVGSTTRCVCKEDVCTSADPAVYNYSSAADCSACRCKQVAASGQKNPYNGTSSTVPLVYNPETNRCDCPLVTDDACKSINYNILNLWHGGNYNARSCACIPCNGNSQFDASEPDPTKRCKCKAGFKDNCENNLNGYVVNATGGWYGCACKECGPKEQVNASKNGCVCKPDPTCTAPKQMNSNCDCICPLQCAVDDGFSVPKDDCSGCKCANNLPEVDVYDQDGNVVGSTCGNTTPGQENWVPYENSDNGIEWIRPE